MPLDSAFGEVSMAYGLNHYLVDKPLRDTLKYFMSREPELAGLGEFVGRELYELAYRVDRMSWPVHVMWSVRGERSDTVLLDPSLRQAVDRLLYEFGVNKPPYIGGSWHEHFASINLVGDLVSLAYSQSQCRRPMPLEVRGGQREGLLQEACGA
ncbi:hypothetical protein [Aeropyrum camini]|uniref:hypothetical protein n=1 Tax=Aeropyrum camini TaxID=229980 RepID=UPI001C4322D4|nr:hypothetical protein [Aeropyrum camini]